MATAEADNTTSFPAIGECRTSIVIPAYNEADNLPPLVDEISDVFNDQGAAYRPYEIIIVDDGSTDDTKTRIRHLAMAHDNVSGIFLRRNFGQSAALAAGFEEATGNYIVPLDADLQNDPADIPHLLDKLDEGYDCVSGWREDRHDPLRKRIPSQIQTILSKATGPNIQDFGCTLKAYRQEALEDIDLYGEGHRYIPAKLHKHGYSVTEQRVNHRERQHGTSNYGAGRLIRGSVDLLFHWFWYRYSTRPLHFLGTLSFILMSAGTVIGSVSAIQRFLLGVPLDPRTPRLIFAALVITVGLQMLVFGVLAEMITKLHYRDTNEYRIQQRIGDPE